MVVCGRLHARVGHCQGILFLRFQGVSPLRAARRLGIIASVRAIMILDSSMVEQPAVNR